MRHRNPKVLSSLLCGSAAIALSWGGAASAEEQRVFDIAAQPLATALMAFGNQSGHAVMAPMELMEAKVSRGFSAPAEPEVALAQLLEGTGLTYSRTGDTFAIVAGGSGAPQSESAVGDGAEVEALIVTAQKREEDIQDVPIAISAFTQEDLTRSQVAGGPDLMTQIPNFTFTKTNFSSYSIQIRGIGTQAISATVDPAVAIAFNNTSFVRNRFFEQEFYDLERIEVLRGPQGTLYGRNATAGVVNVISQKPSNRYEARASADIANYGSTRLEGMINIPLVEDAVALRLAGAWTKRDGYVTNEIGGASIDGRDLWATRLSLRFTPTGRLAVDLVYEHFEEDDDRLRSGKQLCKRNPNPTSYAGVDVPPSTGGSTFDLNVYTSQGCEAASLYSPDSFQVPNGYALGYYGPTCNVSTPVDCNKDPYVSSTQSRDLRVIESMLTPRYTATSDVFQIQAHYDLTPDLRLISETAYSTDELFSFQDFNRFNTTPDAFLPNGGNLNNNLTDENGVFCDPQLGCSNRLLAADVSTARSRQFSQELRLSSDFEGPFNFSAGANFFRYDTVDKYYVFFNSLTMLTMTHGGDWEPGVTDNTFCLRNLNISDPTGAFEPVQSCKYIDPNPIGSLNDYGRQYFLSKNPYKLISYAAFGEALYDITPTLKLTAGLRLTVDKKEAPIVPSQLLAGYSYGLPTLKVIRQEWTEPTGRLVLAWNPDLAFAEEAMVYGSYAHGYKAGGVNPPLPINTFTGEFFAGISASQPPTFEPEFVDAFELGAKTTLPGDVTVNAATFYYDYEGYQISQIANRSAVNMNFDAEVWGAELEVDWRPLENLRLGFKGGYQGTRLADGSQAIDMIDRTAGRSDFVVIKPFPTNPSNCIVPTWWMAWGIEHLGTLPLGPGPNGFIGACGEAYFAGHDPLIGAPYVKDPKFDKSGNLLGPEFAGYPGFNPLDVPNNGEGIFKDLSGNELPNAPKFTATITADYTVPLPNDWLATLHTDLYYQSEAWTRVFNTPGYDKLKAYTNVNLAAIFTNEDAGWKVMAYVKNVFDRDSITGAFLNSDDTGLTTNVFLTEPRLYGLRVTKDWNGGPWWGGAGRDRDRYRPFTVELEGGLQRHDAPQNVFSPAFMNGFSSAIDPRPAQDRDLDWGDGRAIRLTYAPAANGWRIAAGARFGRTNGTNEFAKDEIGDQGCLFTANYDCSDPKYGLVAENYATSTVRTREDHTLVDFSVGREVGLGAAAPGDTSVVSAGLRYAELNSDRRIKINGTPDWSVPDEFAFIKYSQHTEHAASQTSARRFEGTGPTLSWEGSRSLIGDGETGRLGVDWSLTGGVLFGKQTTTVESAVSSVEHDARYGLHRYTAPVGGYSRASQFDRSESVSVPMLDLGLGLSYRVGGVKVGAGYRWERYFDAVDGGNTQPTSHDRTIDGPYFKLAIGFGG